MADLFAVYEPRAPDRRRGVPESLVIRPMVEPDVEALARISHQRNGGKLESHRDGFQRALQLDSDSLDTLTLTAILNDRPVAFGKAGLFVPLTDAPANCAPRGWYLFGVVVAPEVRRLGIGLELTRQRLAYIRHLNADVAYYFASALNLATIDLHARVGFEELTRDFWFPRASFTGGVGILFRKTL